MGLTNGVKIKWLADYCGTSVAVIEKHYGKYLGGDTDEQLSRLVEAKTETLGETVEGRTVTRGVKRLKSFGKKLVGPPGFEPGTNRL